MALWIEEGTKEQGEETYLGGVYLMRYNGGSFRIVLVEAVETHGPLIMPFVSTLAVYTDGRYPEKWNTGELEAVHPGRLISF